MTTQRRYTLFASLAMVVMFLSGIASEAVSVVKVSAENSTQASDTTAKYRLTIPDSLRTTYKYTEAVKRLTIERDTASALQLFDEVLADDSTYAPALFQVASIYQSQGDERGVELARKAYISDTTNTWYTGLYAHNLIYANRLDEALPIYQRLVKMDSKNPDNYRILALLYQRREQPYSAIAILDSADMRLGKMAPLTELKRHLLISTSQHDRAIEEARQAVEAAPYDQSAVVALGMTYAATERDSLAQATLQQAYQMDTTNIEALTSYADYMFRKRKIQAYMNLTATLFRMKEYPLQKKLQMLELFMSNREFYRDNYFSVGTLAATLAILHPTDKRIVDAYGEHLVAGGYIDSALDLFKSHLGDEPPQLDYYMAVIDMEEYLQHTDSVDMYVARAVRLFPQNPVLYIRKANRQYIKGDLQGAVDTFDEAMTYATSDTMRGEIFGFIGDTYHQIAEEVEKREKNKALLKVAKQQSKNFEQSNLSAEEKALLDSLIKRHTTKTTPLYPLRISAKKAMQRCYEAYEKSLVLYADNAAVLNNYAYFLSEEERDLERALAMSSRSINLDKNNATYLDTYAWILHLMGSDEEAQKYMRQALSLDRTNSPELPLHYGDILYALGKTFMAETYWRKALEMGAEPERIEERLQKIKQK